MKKNCNENSRLKIATIILIIVFMTNSIPYSMAIQTNKQVSPDSLSPMLGSQEVYALVELEAPATVSISDEASFSINSPVSMAHQRVLSRNQGEFLSLVNEKKISFTYKASLMHSMNAVILYVRAYHIPLLMSLEGCQQVHVLDDIFETERWNTAINLRIRSENLDTPQRWTGKGTRIGIIDTGVDYLHEDFSPPGIRTENSKTLDGDDFADNEYENGTLIHDDQDPMDDAVQHRGHGTHVAGIATGNNPNIPVATGMAPDAALLAYKVFSSKKNAGGAQGAHIVMAVERSIEDECTVINLSLGHRGHKQEDYEDSPYITVFRNAVKAGVIVVATAGNNGSRFLYDKLDNEWPMSAPGTFESVIQVAATDDRHFYPLSISLSNGKKASINAQKAHFAPPIPVHYSMLDIVDASYGRTEDLANLDLNGKIALISRGPRDNAISFFEKNQNAMKSGALATIIYNYDPFPIIPNLILDGDAADPWAMDFIPCLGISSEGVLWIKEMMEIGGSFSFPYDLPLSIADYTSSGPGPDASSYVFKPELSAPGTSIYSSLPSSLTTEKQTIKWGNRQGTSMAAPVVAGTIALLKEAKPWLSPEQCKALLMNTADIISNPLNNEVFSFFYQGSGQININAALESPVIATPPSIMRSYDDTQDPVIISIENFSDQNVHVDLRSMVYSPKNKDHGQLFVSTDQPFLYLTPGEVRTVQVWFHTDEDLPLLPKTEGVIWLDVYSPIGVGVITHNLHIPFILFHQEQLMQIKDPVDEIRLSSEIFTMNKDHSMQLSFSLNSGLQSRTIDKDDNQRISVRNYANVFAIHIEDLDGMNYGNIFYSELLPVGNYHFEWNGKNTLDHWFLEDGKYNIVFSQRCIITYTEKGERHDVMLPMASVPLTVVDSPLSVPKVFAASYPRILENKRSYTMTIFGLDPEDVMQAEITIEFPIHWENIIVQNSSDNLDFSWEWSHNENGARILYIEALRSFMLHNSPRWKLASLMFTAQYPDDGSIKTRELPKMSAKSKDINGIERKTSTVVPTWVDVSSIIELLDFDKDGRIDDIDKKLLLNEYGKNYLDDNWSPDFDLNGNWKIAIEDLHLFAKYYSK